MIEEDSFHCPRKQLKVLSGCIDMTATVPIANQRRFSLFELLHIEEIGVMFPADRNNSSMFGHPDDLFGYSIGRIAVGDDPSENHRVERVILIRQMVHIP